MAGGAVIIRIPDDKGGRTIDINTDAVTIFLVKAFITKKSNFFKKESQAGVQVGVTVRGRTTDGARVTNDQVTDQSMYKVKIDNFTPGRISLPLNVPILNYFLLSNAGTRINSIQLETNVLKVMGSSGFGVAVEALTNLTKVLPFPSFPFEAGFKMLSTFTTDLVKSSNDAANNIDLRVPYAIINLQFGSGPATDNTYVDGTGAFAVLDEEGDGSDPGYIDIGKVNNYEFKIDSLPSRELSCRRKGATSNFAPVANNYILFIIMAESTAPPKEMAIVHNLIGPNSDRHFKLEHDDFSHLGKQLANTVRVVLSEYNTQPRRSKSNLWSPGIKELSGVELAAKDHIENIYRMKQNGIDHRVLELQAASDKSNVNNRTEKNQ